jgi:hypothetical protein
MRKFLAWSFFIILGGALIAAAITQTMDKKRRSDDYKRMLYISDLKKEVGENLVTCRAAISDSENRDESIILKNRILTNFMNLAEVDFKFGKEASERWMELKKRLKLMGFLKTEEMETEVPGKDVADAYDIFTNLNWLLQKAADHGDNFDF